MDRRTARAVGGAVLLALGAVLNGCRAAAPATSAPDRSGGAAAPAAPVAVADPAGGTATAVTTPPGSDPTARGARRDVTDESCLGTGGTWSAAGTVTNPSGGRRSYRIYVAFVDPRGDTRAVVESNVAGLGAGEQRRWQADAALGVPDNVRCVLRVEFDGATAA